MREHKETTKVTLGSRPPGTVAAARMALTDTAPLIVLITRHADCTAAYEAQGLHYYHQKANSYWSVVTHDARTIVYLRSCNPAYQAMDAVQSDQNAGKTMHKYTRNILLIN